MATQTITVKVDAPDGYDVIDFRPPLPDEPYLSPEGRVRVIHANDFCNQRVPRFILRKRWSAPWFLPAAGEIYHSAAGEWRIQVDGTNLPLKSLYRLHREPWVEPDRTPINLEDCQVEPRQ